MDPHRGFFITKSKQHACQEVLVHRYPPFPPSVADKHPGSEFFPSGIPDPNVFHPESAIKNLSILTPTKFFKLSEI